LRKKSASRCFSSNFLFYSEKNSESEIFFFNPIFVLSQTKNRLFLDHFGRNSEVKICQISKRSKKQKNTPDCTSSSTWISYQSINLKFCLFKNKRKSHSLLGAGWWSHSRINQTRKNTSHTSRNSIFFYREMPNYLHPSEELNPVAILHFPCEEASFFINNLRNQENLRHFSELIFNFSRISEIKI
jgi:hypothetical protein